MKLTLISKYRTHIMGFAILWIMWFHSPFYGKTEVFHFIHNIGFYGVDMFLLVSGLGLYFSMRKSKSIGEFYKKRLVRILPAYLIVSICWYAFFKTDLSFSDKLLAILGVNYFRGTIHGRPEYFDWFLPTLMVLYLLTPLYDKLFQKAGVKWKFTFLSMMISPLLCIIFYHTGQQVLYGSTVRIAIFLVGYWIGWFLYEKREEGKGSWMVHLSLLFCGIALVYYIQTYIKNPTVFWGLNCYPALLAAPAICAFLGALFYLFDRYLKIVGKILLFPFYVCGRYSLEIYLFHQRILEFVAGDKGTSVMKLINDIGINTYSKEYYFLLALLSILLAAALHELIALVIRLITGKKTKKPEPVSEQKTETKETAETIGSVPEPVTE
ncbi:MAG: acyltransferase [Ruminococcus sp.]|uniref:acyltransferase family protein n=1 Tax=Ruminococcus sp. TaxID=41978 RepID=UPI002872AFE4|nr:acyltransferase [Ruminococcus sp.]MBQ3284718.1 acyltransferase [Ruminococcus sp.]